MPKSIYWLSLLTVFTSCASYALAIDKYDDESEYKVYCAAPPPPPGGPYITLSVGSTSEEIEDIAAVVTDTSATPVVVAQPSVSETGTQYSAALGYQIAEYGLFNRAEIVYTRRSTLDYDANPALNLIGINNSIDSTVKNSTLLGKLYWDIYPIKIFVPYLQAGAGIARNTVNSTGTSQLPPLTPVTLTTEHAQTNFAWDAGAGIRAAVTKNIYVDLGYEYDYLGTGLQWQVPFFVSTGTPTTLESGSFHSNAYNLGLTYIFR